MGKRKLGVAFVCPWDTLSGTALQFRQMITYLSNEVDLKVFSEDNPKIAPISTPLGIPWEKCWSRKFDNLTFLIKKLSEFKPDIVHLIHESNWFGVDHRLRQLSRWSLDNNVKLIIQFESPMPQWMDYFSSLECAGYISSSYPEEVLTLTDLGLNNITYIPKPIIEGEMIPKEEAKRILKLRGKTILLNTGFQRNASGYSDIVQGILPILKSNPNLVFIAAGCEHYDEPEPSKYRDDAMRIARKYKIDKQVIFTNKFHSEKELFTYGSASDIYIHYRKNAAFFFASGSIGRAFSFEIPAVAYDHPSLDDIQKGMIRVHSPSELDLGIRLLLANPKLYTELKEESIEIKKERSPLNISKKVLKFYGRI